MLTVELHINGEYFKDLDVSDTLSEVRFDERKLFDRLADLEQSLRQMFPEDDVRIVVVTDNSWKPAKKIKKL